jgi:hypothetical protein
MFRVVNCLLLIPRAVLRYAVDWVRGYLVYLTIFAIVGVAWVAAWARSGEQGHRRLMMPAFTKAELSKNWAEDGDNGAVVEVDGEELRSD